MRKNEDDKKVALKLLNQYFFEHFKILNCLDMLTVIEKLKLKIKVL